MSANPLLRRAALALTTLLLGVTTFSQGAAPRIYKDRITPRWFDENRRFWYENQLAGGAREVIVIDAETGRRERLDKPPEAAGANNEGLRAETQIRPSLRNGPETEIVFENKTAQPIEIFWIDPRGERRTYGQAPAGERKQLRTFAGHIWLVTNPAGDNLGVFEAAEYSATAIIDGARPQGRNQLRRERREREASPASPDRKWTAELREHNLFLKSDSEELQLTRDGDEKSPYTSRVVWSPDSKKLVAFKVDRAERKQTHLIESSPAAGGRARLISRAYALPGDEFSKYETRVFNLETKTDLTPRVDRFEHEWEMPRPRWSRDSSSFAYIQTDRGHQRLRVIQINAADGAVRNLIDERSDTFIWTAHTETLGLNIVTWLEQSDGFIYSSEQSGWRHLYLVNAATGQTNAITTGAWPVRGIESIDETNRVVWFRGSGIYPDQDPYLIHFGRVNFDGSNLIWLTEGNGNHTIQLSPDRKYIIDTHSRVDAAPINELRRVADGKLICKLEEADLSELSASGWRPPEVFVAKARDGQTDIWGIICAPADLDPQKKYPILEDIYAGPHGSFVPKTFAAQQRYRDWNKLGFVVVKIDGLGTANRSKAFHNHAWKNIKDAGFEDRILWIKAAAQKYPWLDATRVGIYGTSAGGQNAAAAVIFHGDFYKAAIANCGCHDNRMDKASWNEQWMGYPVGPKYAANSNIENADKLKGALFLIVGELDTNVPPESTLRLADALIKADKDFDLLVVPGADHGTRGPASTYVDRRMRQFFTRHLLNQ